MKLYTVSWQNRPLVCLESQPGWLTPLPYETRTTGTRSWPGRPRGGGSFPWGT